MKNSINTNKTSDSAEKELCISDVFKSLCVEEQEMIEKGKKHWNLDILNKRRGGYVGSETIKELIGKVIENTWIQAKVFYGNSSEDNVS